MDHLLTASFEQAMRQLGKIGKSQSARHGKGPWCHHGRRRLPFWVCFPMLETFLRIAIVARRIGAI